MIDKEEFCVREATIFAEKGPMSKSKEIDELGEALNLSKVPESFFGKNSIRIQTPYYVLLFNAPNSLNFLKHQNLQSLQSNTTDIATTNISEAYEKVPFVFNSDIKVPKADVWKKSRGLHENSQIVEQQLDQDWTYLNHYRGTMNAHKEINFHIKPNQHGIPKERLTVDNKILYFKDLFLYEDDLGDFGYSQLRLRLRAQADSIFVLLRSYIRVDNHHIRSIDNRIFIDLNDYHIDRDIEFLDGTYDEISQNGFVFDPGFNVDFDQADKITKFMKVVFKQTDSITFNIK